MPELPEEDVPARRAGRELALRIATGIPLAVLILVTLFTSRIAWFAVVAAAILLSLEELFRVLRVRGHHPSSAFGLLAGGSLLVGALAGGPAGLAFSLTLAVIGAFLWFATEHDEHPAEALTMTLFGLAYVALLGSHVVLMRDLPHGPAITVGFIGLTVFYDIGAYTAGSFFGRRPMAPSISPKKSWEGAAGGTLVVFVLALAIGPLIEPFDVGSAAALAAVTAVLAPLGDLAESMLKRDLEVKDMSTLLPGHGGLLDRIDALLIVAPAAYWLMRAVAA